MTIVVAYEAPTIQVQSSFNRVIALHRTLSLLLRMLITLPK